MINAEEQKNALCIPVELLSPICDYNIRCRKLSYCYLFCALGRSCVHLCKSNEMPSNLRGKWMQREKKKFFFPLKICLLLCNVKWLVISYETRSVQKSNTDLVLMMCVCVVVYWTCVRWTFCNKSSGTIDQRMYTTKRNKSRRTQKNSTKTQK